MIKEILQRMEAMNPKAWTSVTNFTKDLPTAFLRGWTAMARAAGVADPQLPIGANLTDMQRMFATNVDPNAVAGLRRWSLENQNPRLTGLATGNLGTAAKLTLPRLARRTPLALGDFG
jgi:hypothetical protein